MRTVPSAPRVGKLMRWTLSPAVVPARRWGAAGFFLVFVMGFFSRLKSGLARTRVNIVGLFSGGVVDEEFFESLEETLIAADVGYKPTSVILQRLRDTVKLKGLKTRQEVRAALRDEIERILLPAQKPMNLEAAKPLVIMMVGVNGAGKTTTIGKIAKWLAAQNKTVLLAAADTFRAAAREQLAVWGERNKIDVITQSGGDPAAVVFDAVSAGRARNTLLVRDEHVRGVGAIHDLLEQQICLRDLEPRGERPVGANALGLQTAAGVRVRDGRVLEAARRDQTPQPRNALRHNLQHTHHAVVRVLRGARRHPHAKAAHIDLHRLGVGHDVVEHLARQDDARVRAGLAVRLDDVLPDQAGRSGDAVHVEEH